MKISGKMSKFLTDTLIKMSNNIFPYFSIQNMLHFFFIFFREKTPILVPARGFAPMSFPHQYV